MRYTTICQTILALYTTAVIRKDIIDMELLIEAYVYAKKMNRRLEMYAKGTYGDIHASEESIRQWTQEITNHAK